jgi:hypothetical protein
MKSAPRFESSLGPFRVQRWWVCCEAKGRAIQSPTLAKCSDCGSALTAVRSAVEIPTAVSAMTTT